MKLQKLLLGSMCGIALFNVAMAQPPAQGTSNQTRSNQPIQRSLQDSESSALAIQRSIEYCLSLDNQSELILAKLATENGKHKEVVAYAKKMHSAHEDCLADLKKIAPWVASQQPLTLATAASNAGSKPAQTQTVQTNTSNPIVNGVGSSDSAILKMQAELAQQCLTDTEAWMTKDDSKDFDECYVGTQLAKHAAMQSKLTVFQRHTSGELKQFITEGIAKNKTMMADSVALMKRISEENKSSKSSE